jgi:hypothetical protein
MGRGEVNFVARLQDALTPMAHPAKPRLAASSPLFFLERGLGQAASRLLPRELLRLQSL